MSDDQLKVIYGSRERKPLSFPKGRIGIDAQEAGIPSIEKAILE